MLFECNYFWLEYANMVGGISVFFSAVSISIIYVWYRQTDDRKISLSGVFGPLYYLFFSGDILQEGKIYVILFRFFLLVGLPTIIFNPC